MTEALALWSGPAWADMLDLQLARVDAQRLEELRLGALESATAGPEREGSGYPGQLHNNPQWSVNFVPLNTRLPPFNDLRVRQALNYTVNRARLAEFYGGSAFAVRGHSPRASAAIRPA